MSRIITLTVSLILFVAGPVAAQNLIENGDFEAGNIGFQSGFVFVNGSIGSDHVYNIVSDPHLVHSSATSYYDHTSGTSAGNMMAVNGRSLESQSPIVWSQTISVTPGQWYDFSFWTSVWYTPPANLVALVNSTPVGAEFGAGDVRGVWNESQHVWYSDANSTATIEILNVTLLFGGNDFAIDDIWFMKSGIVANENESWGGVKALFR
jgi:hypothetical protein